MKLFTARIVAPLATAVLLVTSIPSYAAIIEYTLDDLGGGSYQYNYSVNNNDIVSGIDEFSVYFDLGLYENLVATASPLDWDPLTLQPDPLLPDDGLVDWLAWSTPIALGETLSGFSVSFDWLGQDAPGPQFFEVVDSWTFDVLASGTTVLAAQAPDGEAAVTEPGSIPLVLLGLSLITLARRRCLG